jgi:PAS domain S-box-containing protein
VSNKQSVRSIIRRYSISLLATACATAIVYLLRLIRMRDPAVSIFLNAIGISVWYGGRGPGILAGVLSLVALNAFVHPLDGWFHIGLYNVPYFCVFLGTGWLLYAFSRSVQKQLAHHTAELTRVNQEYETIFNTVPVGIALLDPGRIVRRCNRKYEEMLGAEPGELIGRRAPLPDRERHIWEEQERQLRAGRTIVNHETQRVRIDGTEFFATISISPLTDDLRVYIGAVGLIIDNTARHAWEAERSMLIEMVQQSPDFMGIADLEGNAVVVNRAGQRMFGLPNDEAVLKTTIFEYFADEERDRAQDELVPKLAQQGHLEFETLGKHFETGQTFPLHCTCFVIPDAKTGEPKYLAAVAQDISERRRSEARLQMFCSVVQHSPDFIGIADMNLQSVFVNRAGQAIFGLDGDDEVRRTHTLDYFAEDHRSSVQEELLPLVLERGELTREVPARNFKTGESFPALWTAFVIYDQNTKQPSLLAAITKDITKHRQDRDALEKSLRDNEALLEENSGLQERLRRENISLQEVNLALQGELASIQKNKFERIIGGSQALQRTLIRVDQVAATDATVLITGETGTGKELIAQAIHENSKRARMPFRSVNCASLPAPLIAAELFGYEKGAFTGADRQRVGQFELAAGGTLFLDEIAEIPIDMQATLLRVLEEHAFERLGGSKSIGADVRIIAATNRDLQAAMRMGEFRPDLFYRLNAFPIEVPPLRERRDDIPVLVAHFIAVSAARHGKTIRNIEKRGMELLRSCSWPGNIRELRNVIDTSVIVASDEILSIDEELLLVTRLAEDTPLGSLEKEMANHERTLIERALTTAQGRVSGPSGAATILHLPPSTLSAKIKSLKIDVSRFKPH